MAARPKEVIAKMVAVAEQRLPRDEALRLVRSMVSETPSLLDGRSNHVEKVSRRSEGEAGPRKRKRADNASIAAAFAGAFAGQSL